MTENNLIWMLYDRADLSVNRSFVKLMSEAAQKHGLTVEAVTTEELHFGLTELGTPYCEKHGSRTLPFAVFSRQRNSRISLFLESLGIKVLNNSRVCEICNHKGNTHLFLSGLPMASTEIIVPGSSLLSPYPFPVIVKPARGHGGKMVTVAHSALEYSAALNRIFPDDAIVQPIVNGAGRDLRLYVLYGEIISGVMRTAKNGIISNYKLGGSVAAHSPTMQERFLCEKVIERFNAAGAPLCLAGVDLLYRDGCPVVSEVEDVVGCRMLYETTDIDICSLYIQRFLSLDDKC